MVNLLLSNVSDIEHYLEQLKLKCGDKKVFVSISVLNGLQASRAKYFSVIGGIADHLGYTKSEMHELIKEKVLPKVHEKKEYLIENYDSTSMTTKNLNEYGYEKLLELTRTIFLKKFDFLI